MEERGLKNMQTEKLVDLMEGIDNNRSIFHIIILRDRAMEEHHRDMHTAGPPIGPTYLRSWMNRHNRTTKTKLRTISLSMSGNITH
jgi:hypothetical protein